jgi:hypothetical protein
VLVIGFGAVAPAIGVTERWMFAMASVLNHNRACLSYELLSHQEKVFSHSMTDWCNRLAVECLQVVDKNDYAISSAG